MMELSKKQIKDLMDAINWEIENPCQQFNLDELKVCLDKACISYEEEDG